MIEYSLGLIIGYSLTKALTPFAPRLRTEKYHIHHWMWATILLSLLFLVKLESDILIGMITGIALEGLSYKNWSLLRKNIPMKCKKPELHTPQFEGKHNCQHCRREHSEQNI